jgi:hypothetical protein
VNPGFRKDAITVTRALNACFGKCESAFRKVAFGIDSWI